MRGATLFALLALTVAACSPDDGATEAETTTTAGEAAVTSEPAATTTTPDSTTTTSQPTTTMAAAGGASCLVGEWELDSEAFLEEMTSAMEEQAAGQDVVMEFVGGSYTVSLAESGIFLAQRDEWSFQMVMAEGTFRMTIDGTDTGSWAADEGSLTVSNVESASLLTAQAEVDGELIDLPQGTVPITDTNAVGETSAYTCAGDTLTVDSTEGFTSTLTRVSG